MEDDPKPPFPRVPGEFRYSVGPDDNRVERGRLPDPERTFAEMRLERPPGWVMATLRALHRGVTPDEKPPPSWRKEFNKPESNTALRDFGSDFGLSLRHDPHPDWPDVWYDTRGEHPQKISEHEAICRLWSGHSRVVLTDLGEWGESVASALKRLERDWKPWAAWQQRRRQKEAREAEAEERRQAAAFLKREIWPLGAVLYWIATRDPVRAMQAVRESPGVFTTGETWKSSVALCLFADNLTSGMQSVEPDPWARLQEALLDGDVIALGRRMGVDSLEPIARREWQSDALHLCEMKDGAVWAVAQKFEPAGGPHWTAVAFDRASVLAAFPPPAVLLMEAVRSLFAPDAADREDVETVVTSAAKPPGRPRVERNAAAAVMRDLWKDDAPFPKFQDVNNRLKTLKGEVRAVSRETYDAAKAEVQAERCSTDIPPNAGLAE